MLRKITRLRSGKPCFVFSCADIRCQSSDLLCQTIHLFDLHLCVHQQIGGDGELITDAICACDSTMLKCTGQGKDADTNQQRSEIEQHRGNCNLSLDWFNFALKGGTVKTCAPSFSANKTNAKLPPRIAARTLHNHSIPHCADRTQGPRNNKAVQESANDIGWMRKVVDDCKLLLQHWTRRLGSRETMNREYKQLTQLTTRATSIRQWVTAIAHTEKLRFEIHRFSRL